MNREIFTTSSMQDVPLDPVDAEEIEVSVNEDVRKRGNKWCAYVDDKLTKAEKEGKPKKYKGKKVGSAQRTPSGNIRMKARACYASKKKANNAMAAAMMESSASSAVRSMVREILLEDLKGFQSRTKGIDYMANLDDPTFEDPRQGSLVNKPMARDVKRAWAAEADHRFMDSIIKIHWTGGLDWEKKLRNFLKLSGKNEISTSGYLPGSNKFSSSWGTIGVIVKGRTTLASNDMNTVNSGYHGQVEPETLKKYASSGVPKRPLSFRGPSAWGGGSSKYILDRDSFDPYESRRSEFIVDNWKPVGIIVDIIDFLGTVQFPSVSVEPNIRYAEVVLELGLPVYDWEMKEIPKEKIEAALRGAGGRL